MVKLEEQMTWPELCVYTSDRLKFKNNAEKNKFKEWFMLREKVGYRFDHNLIFRAYKIWCELENNLDHFVVICGREGLGKTTLSIQIASWVWPEFNIESIVYGSNDYIKLLKKKSEEYKTTKNCEISVIALDEGTELLSREAMTKSNTILTKTFFVQRALKCLVIINIPNFHMLDTIVRKHRVKTLIEVTNRGKYKAIVGKAIPIVSKDGERNKEVHNVRIPLGFFWDGYFAKDFPKNIIREEYEAKKMQGIDVLLGGLSDDSTSSKYITIKDFSKVSGMKQPTIRNHVKKGIIKGKKIGNLYYIDKEIAEKIIKNDDFVGF